MHPETQEILKTFEEINRIPRCSKHEEKLSNWLRTRAETRNFEVKTDAVKNVLIKVPASPGRENSPTIVLQGHMDMVCEKVQGSFHDFSKDPVRSVREGDWLRAEETSLGADNGIALALSLVLAESKEAEHPPLELLFTVDEETGLTGANALEPGFFEGKILLNLDSEEEGIFTVGCAGGQNTKITLPLEYEAFDYGQGFDTGKGVDSGKGFGLFRLSVEGLKGGHSGVEIHKQRANAIQVLARGLALLLKETGEMKAEQETEREKVKLVFINGGSAHNSIPNFAEAFLALDRESLEESGELLSGFEKTLREEYAGTDPGLGLKFEELEDIEELRVSESSEGVVSEKKVPTDRVLTAASAEKLVGLLLSLPHGVYRRSDEVEGLVETSNNLATVRTGNGEVEIVSSQRSSFRSRRDEITGIIEAVANLAGANVRHENGYPAWEPDMESDLLTRCTAVYEKIFGEKPEIEVVHAGLECGVIGSKYKGLEMVSLGPTIRAPHSPQEKLHIPSLERVRTFLLALLKSYC
ncbi:MAG: aminoacyl-histidine dipeptidase [Methanosarcinaceae archaeon]|nr:aminoacyl-histidine dipeptidase [Methanosarcinaceae archaeon]